jgi:hypothetical protein
VADAPWLFAVAAIFGFAGSFLWWKLLILQVIVRTDRFPGVYSVRCRCCLTNSRDIQTVLDLLTSK